MELRHLRYFTAVVQWKGYREASRHLYVAQPSISEAVSDLESELRIKLFSREGRVARLTPEGQVFYEEAIKTLLHGDYGTRTDSRRMDRHPASPGITVPTSSMPLRSSMAPTATGIRICGVICSTAYWLTNAGIRSTSSVVAMAFSSSRSLPPRADSTSTVQLVTGLAPGARNSRKPAVSGF